MGFINRLAGPLRRAFSYNKDQQNSILAKGALYPPNLPGGILSGFDGQGITDSLRLDYDIMSSYADYEGMDNYDLISSALDILANDVTQLDYSNGKCMWTTSKDENIKIVLDDLWHKTLRIEEEAWEIARTLVKMGNSYEEILINDKGVAGLNFLDPKSMRRIEGPYGNLVGFVQDFSGKTGYTPEEYERVLQASRGRDKTNKFEMNLAITALEPWEVTHFRLRGKNRRSVYGQSTMDGARWVWKRLMLLEDAATVFRIQRAPERYAFYVDVGDLPAKEALAYLNQVRSMHKKKKMIDPQTGKMSLRWEAISPEEDMYIPIRKGVPGAKVEVLQSPTWQCLCANTHIPLLDGTNPTIKELADKGKEHEFWLYAVDKNARIVPGKGFAARLSHEAAEIWQVGLDNGEIVECTGNHPFLTRDGKWVLAENLTEGQSLMPLYRHLSEPGKDGILKGYERVYDPDSDDYVYTHQRVYEDQHGSKEDLWASGSVIHHKDHDRLNNNPDNLVGMNKKEHQLEHAENVKKMHTPEVQARIRATKATLEHHQKMVEVMKDPVRKAAHIARLTERMKDPAVRAAKVKILSDWNKSQDHIDRITGNNHPKWKEMDEAGLVELIKSSGAKTMRELICKKIVSQNIIQKVLRTSGTTWAKFAQKNIPGWIPKGRAAAKNRQPEYKSPTEYLHERKAKNHKVMFVRKTDRKEPVYDLTVHEHHNFAISQGIIVKNSVEDINYFQDKLFGAMKVPKSYLAHEAGVAKASLSSQDVNFAKTVLRIQREMKNGFKKVARTHLAALGIDPYDVEYDLKMTVPSAIFELAQQEVRVARADLANRMKADVSQYWLLSNVYSLSDDEIKTIFLQQKEDIERQAKNQAAAQSAMGPPGGGGMPMGAPPGGGAPPGAPPPPMGPPPGAGQPQAPVSPEQAAQMSPAAQESLRLTGLRTPGYGRMTEQQLFAGNREHEKRLEDKFDKMLQSDKLTHHRLLEIGQLLGELRSASKR